MKKAIVILLVLVIAVAGVWYFMNRQGGSSNSLSKHIPVNSQMVFSVNLMSIAQKADLTKYKDSEAIQDLLKNMDSTLSKLIKEAIDNPENTGIDFRSNPTIFLSNQGKPEMGFVLKLQDSKKFEDIIKKVADKDLKVQTIGTNNYFNEEGDKKVVMWNNETFLFLLNRTSKTAVAKADSLINGTANSIKDNKFFDASKMNSDFSWYMNYHEMVANQPEFAMRPIKELNIPTKFHLMFGIDFNNGKIEMSSNTIYENKEDKEKMASMRGGKLEQNLLGFVAAESPIAAIQAKMNYEALFDFLMDSKQIADGLGGMSEELGVTRGELRDLLNGDIAIAFTGIEKQEVTTEFMDNVFTSEKTVPHAALYLGLKDKNVWNKLINKSGLQKENGMFRIPIFGQIELKLVETEAGVVIAVGGAEVEKLAKEGKMSEGKFERLDKLKNGTDNSLTYMNFNVQTWPDSMKSFMKKEMREFYGNFEIIMKPFDYAYGTAISPTNGVFTMVMSDEKANSLNQILDMSNTMYLKMKKEREERMKAYEEMMRQYENEGFEEEVEEEAEMIEEAY